MAFNSDARPRKRCFAFMAGVAVMSRQATGLSVPTEVLRTMTPTSPDANREINNWLQSAMSAGALAPPAMEEVSSECESDVAR